MYRFGRAGRAGGMCVTTPKYYSCYTSIIRCVGVGRSRPDPELAECRLRLPFALNRVFGYQLFVRRPTAEPRRPRYL
ncbi:hypothetical protein EVAR_37433_1 [Eumeta japonica]|uniref:Uncharacterized protein n=1 Tax=Eumeta variegata TaxID=151549 RepID=A0A4C1X426_EUMVA|nr:hypothetical protein EVAR_37433_1 [Eumeta japonica]